jgi:hypothetical protein
MRLVVTVVTLALAAHAQEPPPPETQPPPPEYPQQQYPQQQQQYPQQQQQYPQQSPFYTPSTPQTGESTITTVNPGYGGTTLTPPAMLTPAAKVVVSPQMQARWARARFLYGMGGVTGLVGSALTISSVLIVVITGYPCDPNDQIHKINPNDTCNARGMMYQPPKPTDAVPLLAYLGSSVSALGFVFSAAGLGQQHHLLRELNADIGRGPFYGGTTLGLMGFTAVGLGYFFGFTHYLNPHDQGVAILACTITSAAFSALGSLLYAIDASRTKKAWRGLGTF